MKYLNNLSSEEISNLATDEQKKQAFLASHDAYDKCGTYTEELETLIVQNLKEICDRLLASKKAKIITGYFRYIDDITEEKSRHFKSANKFGKYLWQAHPHVGEDKYDGMHMGVLLDENLEYVHIVFASPEVLKHILSLRYE